MKLVLFTTNFPLGASEQFLETEIHYLSKYFEKITLVPLTASGKYEARALPPNTSYLPPLLPFDLVQKKDLFLHGVLSRGNPLPYLKELASSKLFFNPKRLLHWFSASLLARQTFSSPSFRTITNQIDSNTLLYFYWGDKVAALIPQLRNQFPNTKMIMRFHGSDLYETRTPGYMPFRKSILQNLDLAVFISNDGMNFFNQRYPHMPPQRLLARLGVLDHGQGRKSKDGVLRIVSCANVIPLKRIHLLVEAFRQIQWKVHWTHFGEGSLSSTIQKQAQSLPSNISHQFPGTVSNTHLLEFYQTNPVDLFINTSSREGLPVSIMEALSFGIPVIAPAVGGIPEIINPEHGYLLSAASEPQEIVTALNHYHQLSVEKQDTLREEARRFWKKNFDADKNYTDFCRFITSSL